MGEYENLRREFERHVINVANPGFYDDPNFVAEEKKDVDYLNNYASFVRNRPYELPYLSKARAEIPVIAEVVHGELVADGRLGACIDVGMMLSRILEQEQYWNYQVKGSLTIDFPAKYRIRPKYFWSFDLILRGTRGFAAAHSWIVAPPYGIVDIAIKQQPYTEGGDLLPPMVVTENLKRTELAIKDVISPEYLAWAKAQRGLSPQGVVQTDIPYLAKFERRFPPGRVTVGGLRLKYTPVGIGAPDTPFQEMNNWRVNGRLARELYVDIVQPKLRAFRRDHS